MARDGLRVGIGGVEILSVVCGAKFDYGYEPNAGALGGF
jgi:hypothetical protein